MHAKATKPSSANFSVSGHDKAGSPDAYNQIGMGAQILRDLGVGQIRLLGAPLKYNALAGFGLEVVDFVAPPDAAESH